MGNEALKAALLEKAKREQARRAQEQRPVVATTEDGGKVFKLDDGSLSFKSPGYATNDQARIAEIMKGAKPVDLVQRDLDQERISANPIAARVQEFNQGAPIVGEWLDEAVGVVDPQAAQNMRLMSDAMERQNPNESMALNLAGGVAYTVPAIMGAQGGKALDWVAKGGSKLSQALRGGAIAAPAGAIEGAASFSGRAEPGERVKDGKPGLQLVAVWHCC